MNEVELSGIDDALHTRVPYQVVLLGNRLNSVNSRYYANALGIGVIEGRMLSMLSRTQERTSADVCATLGLDQAAASRAIRALNERGLIAIAANGKDARRRSLTLTAEGSAIRDKLIAHIMRRTEISLTGFSAGERVLLAEFIQRMMRNTELLEADCGSQSQL
jgi:DNA-binding MarR family transcriptional regulator